VSSDEKTAFYFRHRAEIEEWAALRDSAREALITELWAVKDRVQSPLSDGAVPYQRDGQWSQLGFTKPEWTEAGWPLSIVLAWNSGQLLNPQSNNEWAYVGVYLAFSPNGPAPKEQSAAVRERCLPAASILGLTNQHANFPVWGFVVPQPGTPELPGYVDACVTRLQDAWSALHAHLDGAVMAETGRAGTAGRP
jgi:hypothetical protein